MESGESPQNIHQESSVQKEIDIKQSDITLVFGQGPVQEERGKPESGRKGLNPFSRVISLSAAELLKSGKTKKVIISGGETGVLAGGPEASNEAELMADIIRRKITRLSADGKAYVVNNKEIAIYNEDGERRNQVDIDNDIKEACKDIVLIENKAKDTMQNFTYILNDFLDKETREGAPEPFVTLLGISFHAKDTYSGAGIGRLEKLAQVFQINGQVLSAEDVLEKLIVQDPNRGSNSYVRLELEKLLEEVKNHKVAILKSRQEELLVMGLRRGDWKKAIQHLESPERVRKMILNDPYILEKMSEQLFNMTRPSNMTKDEFMIKVQAKVNALNINELRQKVLGLSVEGVDENLYRSTKSDVFKKFEEMGEIERPGGKKTGFLPVYGKGEIPPKNESKTS